MGIWSDRKRKRLQQISPTELVLEIPFGRIRHRIWQILHDCIGEVPFAGYSPAHGHRELPDIVWSAYLAFIERFHGPDEIHERMTIPERINSRLARCSTDDFLDIVEIGFHVIRAHYSDWNASEIIRNGYRILLTSEQGVEELNRIFMLHDIGYQLLEGEIVETTSEYAHREIVEPAVVLLHRAGYSRANEEFANAHRHFRSGDYADAITNAAKAFESTMRRVCQERDIDCPDNVTAKRLIELLRDDGVFPGYSEEFTNNLLKVLESGVPTIRNKQGAHGGDEMAASADKSLAALAINLAAGVIVFVVEKHKHTAR